jgi:hypothetical protein
MATPNLAPRADGEGNIGTSVKAWLSGFFKTLNILGEIIFTYIAKPSNPSAGKSKLYFKSDGNLYKLNSAGVEVQVDAAGSGDMLKSTYDIDEDGIVDKAETVDDGAGNSKTALEIKTHIDSTANPHSVDKTDIGLGNVPNLDTTDAVSNEHVQNSDTDLDAAFEATFVKKVDTVNVLSDITSPGADIEDAVTKKHPHSNKAQLDLVTDGDHDIRSDNPHGVEADQISTDNSGENVQSKLDSVDSEITDLKSSVITFIIDGGGSEITTGIKGDILLPFGATITKVTLLADQSGSIVIDIWKDTYANFPPTDADSITASAPPTITTATKSQDGTLSGWTTSITAGDILRFNVDSITDIQRVTLTLEITRT